MFITPRIKEICSMTFEKGLFRIEAGTFHLASDCSNNLNFSPHTWEIQLDRKTVSDIIVRLQTCNVFTIVKHETSVFQDQRRKSWTEKSFYDLIPLRLRVNIIYSWQRKWLNWWNTVLFLLRNNSYEFEKKRDTRIAVEDGRKNELKGSRAHDYTLELLVRWLPAYGLEKLETQNMKKMSDCGR